MAAVTVDVATGTTVTFGTSSFTSELLRVGWDGIEGTSVDTSHMGTAAAGAGKFGNRTFISGDLFDPGTLTLEFHWDPSKRAPLNGVQETVTITSPDGSTWAATGHVEGFNLDLGLDEKMLQNVTVKLSGNVTMTDST